MKPYGSGDKALILNNFSEKFGAELNGRRAELGRKTVALNQSWASSMRPLSIPVLTVLLALVVSSASAAEWGFGSLRIEGFDGFAEVPTQKPPRRLTNSDRTEVLISVFRISPEAEAKVYGGDAEKRLRMHEEGAQRVFERSAQRNEATIPLTREKLSDGTVLISGAVRKSGLFSSGFFLIYMVVAPSERIAMLTVEGRGDPKGEYERYKAHFSSVRWVD